MKALLVIDVQKDFCAGGSLAVAGADEIIPLVNTLMKRSFDNGELVVASQDWHPANHGSFASVNNAPVFSLGTLSGMPQVMWPDHCVEWTDGAAFHTDLLDAPFVFCKGLDPAVDSYSAFFDNGGANPSGLDKFLKERNVDEVMIVGLATDYCVKFTALDAVKLGYKTSVAMDACRAVNSPEGSLEASIAQMLNAGVKIV